jgi:hypothetical protein
MWPTVTRPPRPYLLGEFGDEVNIDVFGADVDIEMHVDIDVKFPRQSDFP